MGQNEEDQSKPRIYEEKPDGSTRSENLGDDVLMHNKKWDTIKALVTLALTTFGPILIVLITSFKG